MRIMAVDYGDTRSGVAISDPSGSLVGSAVTITEKNQSRLLEKLCAIAEENEIERLVIGYPKNMDGTLGRRASQSEVLAKALEETTGLPVVLWDERRTTIESHHILNVSNTRGKKRKAVIDAVAASLILEGYLSFLKASPK